MNCPVCRADDWMTDKHGKERCGTCLVERRNMVFECPVETDDTLPPDALVMASGVTASAYLRGYIIGPMPKDALFERLRRFRAAELESKGEMENDRGTHLAAEGNQV